METMRHGSLFSGIGGFDLAAEWIGWENVFHCEWNDFGKKVLNYYWPNAISYDDITKTDFTIHRGTIDILTGGFPCQPFSAAGKRKGTADDRHLWPEMLRAIREIKPTWIVGENVSGIISWDGGLVFEQVQIDLEAEGYEVQAVVLPACGVGAPHRRDRVWFVGYSIGNRHKGDGYKNSQEKSEWREKAIGGINREEVNTRPNSISDGRSSPNANNSRANNRSGINRNRQKENEGRQKQSRSEYRTNGGNGNAANTNSKRFPGKEHRKMESGRIREKSFSNYWQNFPTQSPICSRNDGISARLDGITFPKWRNESIKAAGNAIVPQVVYQIFKVINTWKQ